MFRGEESSFPLPMTHLQSEVSSRQMPHPALSSWHGAHSGPIKSSFAFLNLVYVVLMTAPNNRSSVPR
jgi:hypothetical protein